MRPAPTERFANARDVRNAMVGGTALVPVKAERRLRRDSATVLPSIASLWNVGDRIPILYNPDRDYDSLIVAVE